MHDKKPYNKKHTTYTEQVELLKSRGMIINDESFALDALQRIGYYRLGFYWHSFETDHEKHLFRSGTEFETITNIYDFDRELRLLVMYALDMIEVSLRTQWVYNLSGKYGSHAYQEEAPHVPNRKQSRQKRDELHRDQKRAHKRWLEALAHLIKSISESEEFFVARFFTKYTNSMPPIWIVSEIMTLGTLSRWIKNLKDAELKDTIADYYQIYPKILVSWLYHLTGVRNRCAHHFYLWNSNFERNPRSVIKIRKNHILASRG